MPPKRKFDDNNDSDLTANETTSHENVGRLFASAKNIMVITGAGISTNAGIPDFRSKGGIYSQLGEYNLDSPEDMFHIDTFKSNPKPFYSFAKSLVSKTTWTPTRCHKFIKLLELKGKLLRNYTQNIDGLEKMSGISSSKVFQCHGSFASASCTVCKFKTSFEGIRSNLESGVVMTCPKCYEKKDGIMKPDIVFFGENVGSKFDTLLLSDLKKVDFFVVIGSSLQISPVAKIIQQLPLKVPKLLVNKELLSPSISFDYCLQGDCDDIVESICKYLDWDLQIGE
ncbi:NAD-dependent protein deacetylase sirtuin-1 [Rhizoclosmatium sp. JEL0117]|nr:NAD-dependent protein deacetylase sirtuin-1 [Rhizoclosmatium sp. JEL0117]